MGIFDWFEPDTNEMLGKGDIKGLIRALRFKNKWSERTIFNSTFVRSDAAYALGKIGDKRAVEPLIQALNDDDHYSVRRSAASALGEIGDKRAVEPLIQALRDKDVRLNAVKALENIGDSRAMEAIGKRGDLMVARTCLGQEVDSILVKLKEENRMKSKKGGYARIASYEDIQRFDLGITKHAFVEKLVTIAKKQANLGYLEDAKKTLDNAYLIANSISTIDLAERDRSGGFGWISTWKNPQEKAEGLKKNALEKVKKAYEFIES